MSCRNVLFLCCKRGDHALRCVCEVTSWLDWWLSTCGSFLEHLTDEARGQFLGGQGNTALGNLMLAHRDSLLLDVVLAEEVARLHYADLPLSLGLFSSLLLDCPPQDACGFERRSCSEDLASIDDSSEVFSRAGQCRVLVRFLSSAYHGGFSPVVPRSQTQASMAPSSSAQQGRKRRGRKGKASFSSAFGGSGGKRKG